MAACLQTSLLRMLPFSYWLGSSPSHARARFAFLAYVLDQGRMYKAARKASDLSATTSMEQPLDRATSQTEEDKIRSQ